MKLQSWVKTGCRLLSAGLTLVTVLTGCQAPTGSDSLTGRPGLGWKRATASPEFGSISYHTSLAFAPAGQTEPLLWVIGGSSNGILKDTVWSSADGVTWSQVSPNSSGEHFSARYYHTSVVFDGKMWVIGGDDSAGAKDDKDDSVGDKNDVWSSADGSNWTWVNQNATEADKLFSARNGHSSLVFTDPYDGKKKIWVLGGIDSSGRKNDVYASPDGIVWKKVTDKADWEPRYGHTSLVFCGKMWVLGGTGPYNDVWSSGDGKQWRQEPNVSWSARYSHSSAVFRDPADNLNKMWVLGGYTDEGYKNDVSWSTNGKIWTQYRLAPWSPRGYHSLVAFKSKLWVIGGYQKNDIWYYPDSPTTAPAPQASTSPATVAGPSS